ncbi:AAA family ATPase [Weissella sagaensis]|uniref:AAA family ATPase n=1 Tax=Weissella sagaensis TaxID=2559928 RepID=UPI0035165CD8
MKTVISQRLWNKLKKYENANFKNYKPVFFQNIEKISKTSQYTNSVAAFFNKFQNDLYATNYFAEPFSKVVDLNDLQYDNSLPEYMTEIKNDGGEFISNVLIAYSDKAGNTIISQQFNTFILERIEQDASVDYLYESGPQKLIYFTFDLNSYKNEYPKTMQEAIRSAVTIGFEVIEMFPSKFNFLPFTSADGAYQFYHDVAFSKATPSDTRIEKNNQGIILIKKGKHKKAIGSSLFVPLLLILAYYKLSHPTLAFDRISFEIYDNGKLLGVSENSISDFLDNLFNGNFRKGVSLRKFDINRSPIKTGKNLLIYGAPGTGKSYYVKSKLVPNFDGMIERITFFNDFDYTDFVGGLKPQQDSEGRVKYVYVPGAFTRVLVDAFNNPEKAHLLIIEELNRANAASVFGEVFQLLDRDSDGVSEYEIFNSELADYLDAHVLGFTNFKVDGIKIPGNMTIIATMNPADQGVQQIDTAFKRRWVSEYMPINFDDAFYGKEPTVDPRFTWKQVGETINDYLLNEVKIEEDALIGQYFLNSGEITNAKIFADKLLGYLWTDAARYSDGLFVQKKFSDVQKTFTNTKRLSDVLTLQEFKDNTIQGSSQVGNQDDKD